MPTDPLDLMGRPTSTDLRVRRKTYRSRGSKTRAACKLAVKKLGSISGDPGQVIGEQSPATGALPRPPAVRWSQAWRCELTFALHLAWYFIIQRSKPKTKFLSHL